VSKTNLHQTTSTPALATARGGWCTYVCIGNPMWLPLCGEYSNHRCTGVNHRCEKGSHVGLPMHIRNSNVGATLAVALNAHTHTQGANTTIQNSTTPAQGDRKGRPYGADTTTGDIP